MRFDSKQLMDDAATIVGAMKLHAARRWKTYAVTFVLAVLAHVAWVSHFSPEAKHASAVAEASELRDSYASELSEAVSAAEEAKSKYESAIECISELSSDTGSTLDCSTYVRKTFHVKFSTWAAIQSPESAVPKASASEREPDARDSELMNRVCSKAPNSPLCGNWDLYFKLKTITLDRLPDTWWPILLGISYAESHVWQNYAKDDVGWTCYGRYNWGGSKYEIRDDNTRQYRRPEKFGYGARTTPSGKVLFEDDYGCNLYPFDSIEHYWTSKVNWFRYGYKGCMNSDKPITCVAYQYVGDPNVAEPSWIRNVSTISQ